MIHAKPHLPSLCLLDMSPLHRELWRRSFLGLSLLRPDCRQTSASLSGNEQILDQLLDVLLILLRLVLLVQLRI